MIGLVILIITFVIMLFCGFMAIVKDNKLSGKIAGNLGVILLVVFSVYLIIYLMFNIKCACIQSEYNDVKEIMKYSCYDKYDNDLFKRVTDVNETITFHKQYLIIQIIDFGEIHKLDYITFKEVNRGDSNA